MLAVFRLLSVASFRRQARLSGGEFALVCSMDSSIRVRAPLHQHSGGVRLLSHVRPPARTDCLINHQRCQAIRLQHASCLLEALGTHRSLHISRFPEGTQTVSICSIVLLLCRSRQHMKFWHKVNEFDKQYFEVFHDSADVSSMNYRMLGVSHLINAFTLYTSGYTLLTIVTMVSVRVADVLYMANESESIFDTLMVPLLTVVAFIPVFYYSQCNRLLRCEKCVFLTRLSTKDFQILLQSLALDSGNDKVILSK